MTDVCRALFVNSGLLGHVSVASLITDAIRFAPEIDARHVSAGVPRTARERLVRAIMCAALAPRSGPAANLDFHRWRAEMHSGVAAARRIRDATASAWSPDVLHFHTQAAAYRSLDLMRRVPAIVSIDCTQTLARDEIEGAIARRTYAPNIRRDGRVFTAARAIVASSEWAARDVWREYPQAAGRVQVMPYPVRVHAESAQWPAWRARRAQAGEAVRFLFVGGDFPRKGGWDLLTAWAACGLGTASTLHVVTNWRVPHDRVPDGVQVVRGIEPYSTAWQSMWRDADVFVMPTHAEAFGMVYQEAAAAGLPSIGTDIAAVPELIEDGVTGVLVQRGDIGGLAAAIRSLASDPSLRRRLGDAAFARALRRWDLATYGRRLAGLVHQCASRERSFA